MVGSQLDVVALGPYAHERNGTACTLFRDNEP